MYLHIGNNKIIRCQDITGIFDLDNATLAASSRSFLRQAQQKGLLVSVSDELPKSMVLCADGRVYLCQISAPALRGRMDGHDAVQR